MGKPSGAAVAARAVAAVAEGHSYQEMDCQAFVEHCVTACGGAMAYAGSNDMARNAMAGLWTLAEAKRLGKLTPGAALFIREADGGEPAKYRADGLGNYSHVGLYAGPGALTDADKNGVSRACDCVHSSSTMGRVAGSTLGNGWTHAGWFAAVAYPETPAAGAPAAGNAAQVQTAAPTADVSCFYTVRRSCKGGAVRRLQTWLADLGFGAGLLATDGDFGSQTEAAARAFQQAQGLVADGVVGRRTWQALAQARAAAQEKAAQA